jgi:sulfide:quinone oxidoreductase
MEATDTPPDRDPAPPSAPGPPARVVVVGGGIAAVECALALTDLAGDRARVSVVAPDPDLVIKPLVVEEPFTGKPAETHELAPLLEAAGAEVVAGAMSSADVDRSRIELSDGSWIDYDALVVCVGGRPCPVYSQAETFWSFSGDMPVDQLIERADETAEGTITLIAPPGTTWVLPLYELALMLRRRTLELGRGEVAIRLLTPEESPLLIFGRHASEGVAELMSARRITVVCGVQMSERGTELVSHPAGISTHGGVMIALPRIEGPRIEGLPMDDHGFIPIDEHCRVEGLDNVYAAGDGANFPVKQGGLATQQADAAAEHLAGALGARLQPQPFKPVLRGQLAAGDESVYLRHNLTGGSGDGLVSSDYLWWPPQKVAGRYLCAVLTGESGALDLDPPARPLDVEASWPHDWHGTPMLG